MSITSEEIEQAKIQLAKLKNKRLDEAAEKVVGKPTKEEPSLPKQAADVSKRKYVRKMPKGCSGFFHPSFLNQ